MKRKSGIIFFLESSLTAPCIWGIFRRALDFCFGFYQKRRSIIQSFGITERSSIIDIGCGIGQYSQLTRNTYLGIDLSPFYIERATTQYASEQKKFLCADVTKVDLKDYIFDFAIMIDVIHHLSDVESRELFRNLNLITVHSVILCEPVEQSPKNFVGRFFTFLDRGQFIRPKKDLLKLVGEQFTITKVANYKLMGIQSICILAKPIHVV